MIPTVNWMLPSSHHLTDCIWLIIVSSTYSKKEVWRGVCNGGSDRRALLQGFHIHCPHDGIENKHETKAENSQGQSQLQQIHQCIHIGCKLLKYQTVSYITLPVIFQWRTYHMADNWWNHSIKFMDVFMCQKCHMLTRQKAEILEVTLLPQWNVSGISLHGTEIT